MLVEIKGANFVNKGAELMLHAVKQKISEWDSSNKVALHVRTGSFSERSEAGFAHILRLESIKLSPLEDAFNSSVGLIPKPLRQTFQIHLEKEVDVILDASGFTYSDQWGPRIAERMVVQTQRWKSQGKRIVLLPQAFGPFEGDRIRTAMQTFLEKVDLVFPRDEISKKYILEVTPKPDRVYQAPDFTNLLKPAPIPESQRLNGKVVVIPNTRMLDKREDKSGNVYINFLKYCIDYIHRANYETIILVHESLDITLAKRLQESLDYSVPVIVEADALRIKSLLADPIFVISSRFHGLVSALSQGVPSLGSGWSHKYKMLFRDYGCEDLLLSPSDSPENISSVLDHLLDSEFRSERRAKILEFGKHLKVESENMWSHVHTILEGL